MLPNHLIEVRFLGGVQRPIASAVEMRSVPAKSNVCIPHLSRSTTGLSTALGDSQVEEQESQGCMVVRFTGVDACLSGKIGRVQSPLRPRIIE